MIEEILYNKVIISCAVAFLAAQLLKTIIDLDSRKSWLASFLETGGMPSSHASLVTALSASIYFQQGLTPLFVVTSVFSIIVIRDAFGVRQATGQNTKVIKRMIETLKLQKKLNPDQLQEIMGHTLFQVIVGVIIGLVVAFLIQFSDTYSGLFVMFGTALYYASPGLISNMIPVFVRRIRFLDIPVDLGKSWRGKRIFGSHKTYRGFFFAILFAIFLVYIQTLLYDVHFFWTISYINYANLGAHEIILLGFLLGFGALFGDLMKSFIKRRMNIEPGRSFFPWDQLDYVIGILAFVWIFKAPTFEMTLALLILGPAAHLLFCLIGYHLKLKKDKI